MKKLLTLSLRLTLLALVIAVAAYFIPTGYILRAPGHADDLSKIVHVQGGDARAPGELFMTTVIYEKANLLFCFYSLFDRHAMLVPADESAYRRVAVPPSHLRMPSFGSPEDMMTQSKDVAKLVALRKLGYDIKVESTGVRVIGFLDNVPAAAVLRVGDVIDMVEGKRVRSVPQLREVLSRRKKGDAVTVQYRRGPKTAEVTFPVIEYAGKTLIGIMSQDAVEHVKLPVDIEIETHNVNGASAGLMFTLEIIHQLTPGGITKGHKVAGTGTIELNGNVGPIEGTELKEVAAQRVGATIFLVPEDNYPDIKDRMPGMQVVPVKNLDDALRALRSLP